MVASINIVTEYPLWFSLFCLLTGGLYAFILYFKENRFTDAGKWLLLVLSGLRFLLVSVIAFLLLSPFIKTLFNKVEKPVVVFAQDNSSSVLLNKDSAFYKGEYMTSLQTMKEALSEDYEVRTFVFGERVEEGLNVDYSNQLTDISMAMEDINTKFYNRNVGAVILASDGIFNRGSNPLYGSPNEFPVYTIAMGDTTLQKDIVLAEVIHNQLTFLGNQFPLEILANAYQCKGATTKLTVYHKNKEVYTRTFQIDKNIQSFEDHILLEAKDVGMQYYRIELSTIKGELSIVNNVKDIYIEVLDGRQNVLLLAHAPHPDLKALKLGIEQNENYEVTTTFVSEFDGNLEPYSLVVFHQPQNAATQVIKSIMDQKVSVLFILGNHSDLASFNRIGVGLSISQSRNKSNDMLPAIDPNFPLFTLSDHAVDVIKDMPPLEGPFGNYKTGSNGYALLNQRIGNVTTDSPLLIFFQQQERKLGVLVGEGIWRWRMQDYLKNNNHQAIDELINKTVQFLAVKEDKSKFRVYSDQNFYENEEILFKAELYNQSYELVNEPEVALMLKDEEGKSYSYSFNRNTNSYVLNAGRLPAGRYVYTASVKLGENKYTSSGKLTINELQLEANQTVANHQLMQNMAKKFGGKLYYPNQIKDLVKEIKSNENIASLIYEERELKEVIHLKWIFFFILALLTLEWFLRKRNGAY